MEEALKALWWKTGEWEKGCQIVICTDAVAAYLLRCEETELPQWNELIIVQTLQEFAAWVEKARDTGMRNDDSTVAIVRVAENQPKQSVQ